MRVQRFLILEDDPNLSGVLKKVFGTYLVNLGALETADPVVARGLLQGDPSICLLVAGYGLRGYTETGLDVIRWAREHRPDVGCVLTTGGADIRELPEGVPVLLQPFGIAKAVEALKAIGVG